MAIGKVHTKIIQSAISKLGKVNFEVPKNAAVFDFVSGVSKKGDFSIYSFKDASGKLLKKELSFCNERGNVTNITRKYYELENNTIALWEKILQNGREKEFQIRKFTPLKTTKDKKYFLYRQENHVPNEMDTHKIGLLGQGEKAKTIEYKFDWQEAPDIIAYTEALDKYIPEKYLFALPLVISDTTVLRAAQRSDYISNTLIKQQGLQGLTKKAKRVAQSELGIDTCGICSFSGEVSITRCARKSEDLLEILSHEYRHVRDLSDIYRTEEFINNYRNFSKAELNQMEQDCPGIIEFIEKSIKKGVIKKSNPQYQRLQELNQSLNSYKSNWISKTEHDEHIFEKSAIDEQNQIVQKFNELREEIIDFFKSII